MDFWQNAKSFLEISQYILVKSCLDSTFLSFFADEKQMYFFRRFERRASADFLMVFLTLRCSSESLRHVWLN